MITRPVRERPADQVRTMVREGLLRTGYDEVSLTSLSTADFSGIERVVAETVDATGLCGPTSVSLPSLGSTPSPWASRPRWPEPGARG